MQFACSIYLIITIIKYLIHHTITTNITKHFHVHAVCMYNMHLSTTITNTELMESSGQQAFYLSWHSAGMWVQSPAGGPKVALFAVGQSWVLKYMILTLKNFLHLI